MGIIWSPDTCSCKVSIDDAGNFESLVTRCDHHKSSTVDMVVDENRTKNKVMSAVKSLEATAAWSFDSNRNLIIEVTSGDRDEVSREVAKISDGVRVV